MLAAIILAAGASQRMGTPKALVAYARRPFLKHLLDATRHPKIGLTRVVLGANAEEIRAKVRIDDAMLVINADWEKGQLSSIQAALHSLPAGLTQGILVCLVDHPLITPHLVADLIARFEKSPDSLIIPTFNGKRGHPVIFPSRLYGELLTAPADVGARAVVWAHANEVIEVPTSEEGVVLNLNDPDTLRRALSTE